MGFNIDAFRQVCQDVLDDDALPNSHNGLCLELKTRIRNETNYYGNEAYHIVSFYIDTNDLPDSLGPAGQMTDLRRKCLRDLLEWNQSNFDKALEYFED